MKCNPTWLAAFAALAVLGGCSRGELSKAELARELKVSSGRVVALKPDDFELAPARPMVPITEPYIQVWSVKETAADSLGRIGEAAIPQLVEALSHPDPEVREQAARALSLIGPKAASAVPTLVQLLQDRSEPVRRQAARALGQIGPAARSAIPDLIKALERPEAKPASDQEPPSLPNGPRNQASTG